MTSLGQGGDHRAECHQGFVDVGALTETGSGGAGRFGALTAEEIEGKVRDGALGMKWVWVE